ncbi:MAG: ABC transporter permease, partial [Lentisphaerae bacterium]
MLNNPIFQREIKTSLRAPKVMFLILAFLAFLGLVLTFLWPKTGIYSQRSSVGIQVFAIFLMTNLTLILLLVPALASPAITSERERNSYELLFTSLLTPGEILRGKLFSSLSLILLVVLLSLPISALCALSGGIAPPFLLRALSIIVVSAFTYGLISLAISALCRGTFVALMASYLTVMFFAGCTWLPSVLIRNPRYTFLLTAIRCISPFDAMLSILYPNRYQQTQIADFTQHNPYFFYNLFLIGNAVIIVAALIIFCKYVVSPPGGGIFYYVAGWGLVFLVLGAVIVEATSGYDYYRTITQQRDAYISRYAKYMKANQSSKKAKRKKRSAKVKKPTQIPRFARQYGEDKLTQFYLIMLLLVIMDGVGLYLARYCFRKARQSSKQYEEHYDSTGKAIKRHLGWPFYLFDPLKRKKPIGRWRNPVFVAELRSQIFARPRFIIYGLSICIAISMLLLIMTCFQFGEWLTPEKVFTVAIMFQVGIISVLAPAVASGSITNEIAARTFPMLRMTPLSATTVVMGKIKAAFLYVSIFLVSSLPVLFSLAFLDYSQEISTFQAFWRVGAWLAILVVVTVTFIIAGFFFSS